MASASPWVMWSLAAMFVLVYNRLLQNYLGCMLMMGETMAHIWHSHSS